MFILDLTFFAEDDRKFVVGKRLRQAVRVLVKEVHKATAVAMIRELFALSLNDSVRICDLIVRMDSGSIEDVL